jgi:exodeoxyribonuclease V alpha subunit
MTQWQAASAGRVYRIGDKVMQLHNNYDTGTAGCSTARSGVTALLLEDSDLRMLLNEDEEVAYGFDELDELTYAYRSASTAPKAANTLRGYPGDDQRLADAAAQLALHRRHSAKRMVVLVGSRRALAKAVRTQGAGRRCTALTERLQ